jgi:soluble epoxide hydrolase/lipid-phosphate phosphatase
LERIPISFTFVSPLLIHIMAIDKNDPSTFNHNYVTANGIRMHYVDENASSDKPLLLLHGWPDL